MTALQDHMKSIMTTPESSAGNLAPASLGGPDPYGIPAEANLTEPASTTPATSAPPALTGKYPIPPMQALLWSGAAWDQIPLDPAMYAYWGGDDILKAAQQFDPNARWVPTTAQGTEGSQLNAVRLDVDFSKLPAPGSYSGWSGGDMFVPADPGRVHNKQLMYNDPLYGWVTPHWNATQIGVPGWSKWAPLVIGGVAGLAGGAAVSGAAGLTAAEAGPGAAAAVGSQAAGQVAAPWWASQAVKAIPTIGRTVSGVTSPQEVPPYWNTPNPDFNPNAFNATGSAKKTAAGNESALVATQFADDPYGMSHGAG